MLPGRMNFGKHRGRLISEVPTGYLQWALGECDSLDAWLRHAIEEELHKRQGQQSYRSGYQGERRQPGSGSHPPPADWSAVLGSVRRRLALQHHPDRGGDVRVMQGVNLALDAVEQELAEVE